jgi:DNA topoisomerase-1
LKERIERLETKKKDKDQLKEVSTSTSKVNYIDPRVTLAWCKKVDLDPKKVFSATLRSKFAWAFAEVEAKPDFKF